MLIVGINGSPNKEGNIGYLLNYILEKTKALGSEYEIINANEVLNSCGNPFCVVCSTPCNGNCYKGTDLERAYELITKADGILIGSPVYFGTLSAQLKAFFDKTRGYRGKKVWINKVGAGVTVGASKYGGQETTIRAIHDIMLVHGMMIVGDGQAFHDAGHHGVCAQKPANEDLYAIARANILARRMVEVCTATKVLRANEF